MTADDAAYIAGLLTRNGNQGRFPLPPHGHVHRGFCGLYLRALLSKLCRTRTRRCRSPRMSSSSCGGGRCY
jgi:hypothetical protein